MSHSEMLSGEIDTLRRLRRHRADRAERALREAKRAQQALVAHIREMQEVLERTRQEEARQCAQLLSEHQGQVVTFKALKNWSAKEQEFVGGYAARRTPIAAAARAAARAGGAGQPGAKAGHFMLAPSRKNSRVV